MGIYRKVNGKRRKLAYWIQQSEGEKEREAKNKEVSGGVEVNELEVREADCSDDPKHDGEDAPDDWVGDGDEECPKFADHTKAKHDEGGVLDDSPASHLVTHHHD